MKKFIVAALIALAGISVTFSSCNKYEDGPKISLLTKKARLCNDWVIEKYMVNGHDETDATDMTSSIQSFFGNDFVWSIKKDETYSQTGNFNESGTWKLGEDKDDVTFTPGSGSSSTYRILRLKSKELRLRETNSNGTYNYIFLKEK